MSWARVSALLAIGAVTALAASCAPIPLGAAPAAAPSCPAVATTGPDVDAVRRLEERGARVNVEGWTIEEARAFFAPDFVSVQPNGSVNGLETVFSSFADGRSRPWARSFDLVELDVHIYNCNAAVVVGLAEAHPLGTAESAPPLRLRFLNAWRKQDGRWLYAGNQYVVN